METIEQETYPITVYRDWETLGNKTTRLPHRRLMQTPRCPFSRSADPTAYT